MDDIYGYGCAPPAAMDESPLVNMFIHWDFRPIFTFSIKCTRAKKMLWIIYAYFVGE